MIFAGGPELRCDHHRHHRRGPVDVVLDGRFPRLPDVPAVPGRLATRFSMHLFDYRRYFEGAERFCVGRCQVSRAVREQGVWEAAETVAFLAALDAHPDGIVLDLGAQLGWYTLAAAARGRDVVAVDANRERLEMLVQSAEASGLGARVRTERGWIGPRTPEVDADGPPVAVVKADIEGFEPDAVRVLWPLIRAGRVGALLLEVSPCFRCGYDRMLLDLAAEGYAVARIRGKNLPAAYSEDPLAFLAERTIPPDDLRDAVESWSQENVLCWRPT